MSELFGAPSGIQAAIKDEHEQTTTRYNNSMAQKAELESQQALKFQQLMQQQGLGLQQVGTAEDPVAQLTSIANLAFQAGNVKMGTELADKASLIARRRTQDDKSLADIEKGEFETNIKGAKLAGELANGVTDQASWDRANATFELLTGTPSPYANAPYSPELVKTVQSSMITAQQRLTADYQSREHERKKAHDKAVEQTANANLGLRKQELTLKRERETRIAKEGGTKLKPAGMPLKSEVANATALLEGMNITEGDIDMAATDVAQEARRIWKANPAVTPQEAMAQVIGQKLRAGDLMPGKKTGWFDTELDSKGRVFSPLRPANAPSSKDDLVKGQYYRTARGVAKWDGKNFTLAKLPAMATSGGSGAEDDDEDTE